VKRRRGGAEGCRFPGATRSHRHTAIFSRTHPPTAARHAADRHLSAECLCLCDVAGNVGGVSDLA
jgi:hypothetical protein